MNDNWESYFNNDIFSLPPLWRTKYRFSVMKYTAYTKKSVWEQELRLELKSWLERWLYHLLAMGLLK
jgi:hypothetical protein